MSSEHANIVDQNFHVNYYTSPQSSHSQQDYFSQYMAMSALALRTGLCSVMCLIYTHFITENFRFML